MIRVNVTGGVAVSSNEKTEIAMQIEKCLKEVLTKRNLEITDINIKLGKKVQ